MKYLLITLLFSSLSIAQTTPGQGARATSTPQFLLDLNAEVLAKRQTLMELRERFARLPILVPAQRQELQTATQAVIDAQDKLVREYRRCERELQSQPRCNPPVVRIEPRAPQQIPIGIDTVNVPPAVTLETLQAPVDEDVEVASVEAPVSISSTNSTFKLETCKWASELPRKIVQGPGCNRGESRICVGYVICDRSDDSGKFMRLSTCSARHCGESDRDAQSCTRQAGYSSANPAGLISDDTIRAINPQSSTPAAGQ